MKRLRLIAARERLQLSQEEMARRAGLSRSAYLRIENGITTTIRRSTRRKLTCVITDEPIDEVLTSYPTVTAAAHRDAAVRYSRSLPIPSNAFTVDHNLRWGEGHRLDREITTVPAEAHVAELLNIAEGTPVLRRQFLFWANDVPQQSSVSYLPAALVAGTPVEDPDNEPWPGGTIAQLAMVGCEVTAVRESVVARMPTSVEQRALCIPPGIPVLTVTRTMLAGDEPVEAAVDIVMPADRHVLHYTIDLRRDSHE